MADDNDMGAPRRQTFWVVVAAIAGAVLLFLLWFFFVRTPYAPAFTGINSSDALTITQELDKLKTPYELADDGATILVPQDRVDAARVNILGSELPLKGAVGFELFNKTDMGLTEFAQKINYQRALQGELARTIMALEEVENARVHLSLPESGIFEQDRRPAKASITIATKLGGPVDAKVVRGIQQLVASGVPDLTAENVAILDSRGELLSVTPVTLDPASIPAEQAERQAVELSYASRVEDAVRAAGLAMPMLVKVTALKSFDTARADESEENATEVEPKPERDFPLHISVSLPAEPGGPVKERLLAAARTAVAFDATIGDRIATQIDSSLGAISEPIAQMTKPVQARKQNSSLSAFQQIPLWPFAVLILTAVVLVLLFKARKARLVSSHLQEREHFAEKLKSLLDQEGTDGRAAR